MICLPFWIQYENVRLYMNGLCLHFNWICKINQTRYIYQQVDIEKAPESITKRLGLGWKITKVIWKLYQERSTWCYTSTSSTQGQIGSSYFFPRSTYVRRWIFLNFKTVTVCTSCNYPHNMPTIMDALMLYIIGIRLQVKFRKSKLLPLNM